MDGAARRAAELPLREVEGRGLDMAIWLTENTKVIVQGMTGSEGTKHTRRMLASGTQVVGGVNPRKAGTTVDVDGTQVPVFGTVAEAMKETGADVSVVFVPPAFAKDAVIEAVDAAIPLCVVITEGIPVHDTAAFYQYARQRRHHPDHRAELPRPDQPRASPTPASSRPTSPRPAGSAWSPSPAR